MKQILEQNILAIIKQLLDKKKEINLRTKCFSDNQSVIACTLESNQDRISHPKSEQLGCLKENCQSNIITRVNLKKQEYILNIYIYIVKIEILKIIER